jgi:hypothetical protein
MSAYAVLVAVHPQPFAPRRFVFISTNAWTAWGGSEELWSAAATRLAEEGHIVRVYKLNIDERQPRIRRLRELACSVTELARPPLLPKTIHSRLLSRLGSQHPISRVWLYSARHAAYVRFHLQQLRPAPDLVVVSQGGNQDGATVGDACRKLGLPFVLISQRASDRYWPPDSALARLRAVYDAATAVYFVSSDLRVLGA